MVRPDHGSVRRLNTSSCTLVDDRLGSKEQRCDPPNPVPVEAGPAQLGVSVQQHPSPPLGVESGKTHSLKGGPDRNLSRSQPL